MKISALKVAMMLCGVAILHSLNTPKTLSQQAFAPAAKREARGELLISAAASMRDAMTQIAAQYRKEHSRVGLHLNFGASGMLQKQIEQGAQVDIFVSASRKNIDELAAQNLIEKKSIRVIARNRLVLIVPKSATRSSTRFVIKSFRDLARADVRNVALGAPQSVPAGKYAQQVLTRIGVWSRVVPKAVQGKDVRAVLTQVELGNVDAGIVYQSDAASSNAVRVVAVAPEKLHSPIQYLAAVVRDSKNSYAARDFVRYLTSEETQALLKKWHFVM